MGMKKISLQISLFMFLVLLGACSSGPVGKRATGLAYEVVVVMKKADWDGPSGKAIKQELTSDVPGLRQIRTFQRDVGDSMKTNQVNPAIYII